MIDNSLPHCLHNVFLELNKNKILYFVLRDYEDLQIDGDIDIYLCREQLKKVKDILNTMGWLDLKINTNAIGHIQFFKYDDGRFFKIDFLNNTCFNNGHYWLNKKYCSLLNGVVLHPKGYFVPNNFVGFVLLLCHCVLDKSFFSSKNWQQLISLAKEIIETKQDRLLPNDLHSLIVQISQNIKPDVGYCLKIIKRNRIVIKEKHLLLELRRYFNIVRSKVQRKPNVAFVGVDGSGKSTTIKNLFDVVGERASYAYLGFKDYQTKKAKKYCSAHYKPKVKILFVPLYYYCLWQEMRFRIKNAKKEKSFLIICDRYPYECYDNSNGNPVIKVITYVLFKLLMEKPSLIVYLKCSVDTSLLRKNDIQNVDSFIQMKNRFDKKYSKDKNLVFDTDLIDSKTINQTLLTKICWLTSGKIQ